MALAIPLSLAASAHAEESKAEDEGPKISIGRKGFKVESADGFYMFDIGGRVQADYSHHFGSVTQPLVGATPAPLYGANAPLDGTELRRGRIETSARVAGDFFFAGDVDFGDDKTRVKDFLVGYDGFDGFKIILGNGKQPYSLVVEESSNDISFVERGIDSFLVTRFSDRAIGARFEGTGDHFFVAGGVFGEDVSSDDTTDGWGVVGRAVWTPIQSDDSVLHLGFRTLYRQPSDDDKSVQIKDETTHQSDLSVVDTGNLLNNDFKDITMFGPEVAFAWRFVALRGEYNYAHTRRRMNQSVGLQSGHVSLSFGLTGQSWADAYKMSAGEFRRLENVHDFDPRNGHWGGLELATRWSFLDLNDGTVTGGWEQAISTDLIWQLNYNVRMMFDWTHIVQTKGPSWNDPVNATAEGLDMITVRVQFAF